MCHCITVIKYQTPDSDSFKFFPVSPHKHGKIGGEVWALGWEVGSFSNCEAWKEIRKERWGIEGKGAIKASDRLLLKQ